MTRGANSAYSPARRALRTTVIACWSGALACAALFSLAGAQRAGLALAAGLVIGSLNGHWAVRNLGSEVSFRLTSMGRLAVLTAAALGAGFLLGTGVVWLALAGVAAAQLALAGAGLREALAAR